MKTFFSFLLIGILFSFIAIFSKHFTIQAAGTQMNLTLFLHGIGNGGDNVNPLSIGNTMPVHTQRTVTIEIFNASNALVLTKDGTVIYSNTKGNFSGTIDVSSLGAGVYTAKVKVPGYLKKTVPGIATVSVGTTLALPDMRLTAGDSNNDNKLSILDYNMLIDCFSDLSPARNCADVNKKLTTDLTDDGNVNQFDYNLMLRELSVQSGDGDPLPTSLPTAGSSPTSGITPTTSIAPSTGIGVWISQQELMKLPMIGATWTQMNSIANSDIGSANMSDQNSPHGEKVLALALVAARTQNQALITKAVTEVTEIIGTEKNPDPDCASSTLGARGLAVGRNLLEYVVAADVLNLRSGGYDPNGKGTQMQQWIDSIRHRRNCDNNGAAALSGDICQGMDGSTSNGNTMAGASCIAAAMYMKDTSTVDQKWLTFRRYAGDSTVGPNFSANSYSGRWKSTSPPNYVGINPKGAHCTGTSSAYPADGVLPNDQGRGGDCPTDPLKAPIYGPGFQYPWEGLQGAYAQALIFYRAGYKDPKGNDPWHVSDSALLRAVQYQWYLTTLPPHDQSWYDSNRAAWVKHLAYYFYGYKPIQYAPFGSGRNMDWAQWTLQK